MTEYDYDVALSFAGEDRDYVQKVADVLHQLGVKVFYDKYEEVDMWGKDLYTHLDNIYQKRAKYCVIFASEHYRKKLWTNHERESAQARAFVQNEEYILPARFDETAIPGIRPTTGYLDLSQRSPEELAYLTAQKIGLNVELDEMISFLKSYLGTYKIEIDGTELVFDSRIEDYHATFPVRLMLEMHRAGQLEYMFLMPGIVPF